jgi:hypothetical protein
VMAKTQRKIPVKGEKRLEMAMRDVMDGLADSACYFAFRSTPDTLEILSIEPPKPTTWEQHSAEIIQVKDFQSRSRDIVEFLIRRETALERLAAN